MQPVSDEHNASDRGDGPDEEKAILSKCLSLIRKTTASLRSLDGGQFPTAASNDACSLLLKVLDQLKQPATLDQATPAVLYNGLFRIRELAGFVEASSMADISWPLVSYCDEIWRGLFGDCGPKIFFTLTAEHNYAIGRFADSLRSHLAGVLPKRRIDELIGPNEIYYLQLASAEDGNLPLYAIIGHEFGHVLWQDPARKELRTSLQEELSPVLSATYRVLLAHDSAKAVHRLSRAGLVIHELAEELFSDLVGSLLMGPAYFLSLRELLWGKSDRGAWSCNLRSTHAAGKRRPGESSYPSDLFRLDRVRRWTDMKSFFSGLTSAPSDPPTFWPKALPFTAASIPGSLSASDEDNRIVLHPALDPDAEAIRQALSDQLESLKSSLTCFLDRCVQRVRQWYPEISPVRLPEVVALLERLEHKILPNIVPDTTLLGKCPEFTSILNASALYRFHLLVTAANGTPDEHARQSGIVERLTAKAFEVTFIQREYRKWTEKARHGNPQ